MSTFLDIARYENRDSDFGERLPITPEHLDAAAARQPQFQVLREEGALGVRVLSNAVAVLEEGGRLSCRVERGVDTELLTRTLCELAALIPDAVVEDEEGNALSETP